MEFMEVLKKINSIFSMISLLKTSFIIKIKTFAPLALRAFALM
jgi:hypothetical protein